MSHWKLCEKRSVFLCPCVKETFQDHEVWTGKERERRGRRTCEKDGLDLHDSPSCGIPSHFSWPSFLLAGNVRGFYSESSLNYSKRCKRELMHTWVQRGFSFYARYMCVSFHTRVGKSENRKEVHLVKYCTVSWKTHQGLTWMNSDSQKKWHLN